ncbi:hypothetical protein HJG60_008023 [Phyllostomus discolor]|uniref:Uncharacterized protein n=1 Tax=Phyllostomus discolor TaxID=89673 RepID=A0A834BK07_9CHIR|nr:hypothetical protein HJG60_008023 [Phyllostomus discolor]
MAGIAKIQQYLSCIFGEKQLLVTEGSRGSTTSWYVTLFQPMPTKMEFSLLHWVPGLHLGFPDKKFPILCSGTVQRRRNPGLRRLSGLFREVSLMSFSQVWNPEKHGGFLVLGFFKRFYLFIFRERGREGERQGKKH